MKKVRIGIVGLGRLGFIHATNIGSIIKNAELSAACSLNKEELSRAKKELNVDHCFTDFKEMIKSES